MGTFKAVEPDFGSNLRDWRLLRGLKQASLAGDLGVSRSAVAKWETGLDLPRPFLLNKIRRLMAEPNTTTELMLVELVSRATGCVVIFDLNNTLMAVSPAAAADLLADGFSATIGDRVFPVADEIYDTYWKAYKAGRTAVAVGYGGIDYALFEQGHYKVSSTSRLITAGVSQPFHINSYAVEPTETPFGAPICR